jgi:hypothetical protein
MGKVAARLNGREKKREESQAGRLKRKRKRRKMLALLSSDGMKEKTESDTAPCSQAAYERKAPKQSNMVKVTLQSPNIGKKSAYHSLKRPCSTSHRTKR